jgi:hypothetical protein
VLSPLDELWIVMSILICILLVGLTFDSSRARPWVGGKMMLDGASYKATRLGKVSTALAHIPADFHFAPKADL